MRSKRLEIDELQGVGFWDPMGVVWKPTHVTHLRCDSEGYHPVWSTCMQLDIHCTQFIDAVFVYNFQFYPAQYRSAFLLHCKI